jgi:hypothetical protein
MINWQDAKVGFAVFYQQPYMTAPEYGTIRCIDHAPKYIHVLFLGDTTAKACYPRDLHWPPDFCAQDRANPEGQLFGKS